MYIVIDDNKRIPSELDGFIVENWTQEEFFTKASSDEGLDIDEGIWYNVSILSEDIYNALKSYVEAGIAIIYYRFDDEPDADFTITEEVKVFSTQPEETEEEIEETEEKTEETMVENTNETVEEEQNTVTETPPPVVEQPQPVVVEQPQPVVEQPQPVVQPIPQPVVQEVPPVVAEPQPVAQPTPQPVVQPVVTPIVTQPIVDTPKEEPKEEHKEEHKQSAISSEIKARNLSNMLQYDDYDRGDASSRRKAAPAKVILFGSSKGGTGKTFTCLISTYWYAKTHPSQKVALADFDIIDGQIGITINKVTPTMQNYWKLYKNDQKEFMHLENQKSMSDHFSSNVDFYLAPSQDIPAITNDYKFWNDVFEKLINNYDVVFFDSGIDYIGKPPISQLYRIADRIIITSNPSINSVKSVIKQLKTLSGERVNNVFKSGDHILDKVNLVLTRMSDESPEINAIVENNLSKFAPIVAKFGQIDHIISKVQWEQQWELIDANPDIFEQVENIIDFDEEE